MANMPGVRTLRTQLDQTLHSIQQQADVNGVMNQLVHALHEARLRRSHAEWHARVIPEVRQHRLFGLLQQDPSVRHSLLRPRGYPGDAALIDYIYGTADITARLRESSELGRKIYGYTSAAPAAQAVRNRLSITAYEIDHTARRQEKARVMAVACGHLREAAHVNCLRSRNLDCLVAMDQDTASLDVVRSECSGFPVLPMRMSAMELIRRPPDVLGTFDFIYALGLYDYLSDATASRLLARLVDLLNPGGKLWIANFLPQLPFSAFMEAAMDWWLVYRSTTQLDSLADAADRSKIASRRTFFEDENHVAFLEIIHS